VLDTAQLDHEFTTPGYYTVSVVGSGGGVSVNDTTVLNNVYARREIRDLTSDEWDAWVDTMWTIKQTSTADGRARFNCPTGRQEDYHTHDYFIALHGSASANTTCDQLHFSQMQEFAHLAWNTMLERAMQCVDPSVTLTYWNEAIDHRLYHDPSLGAASLLRSPIWGDDYMGGGKNFGEDPSNPYYYVTNGRFANFPIRQNRTGLCEELDELNDVSAAHCAAWIDLDESTGFRGPKETTGFWFQQPRPLEGYEFVSRRPGFLFGSDSVALSEFPSDNDVDRASINAPSLRSAILLIMDDLIHGRMHYWGSGVWQPSDHGGEAVPSSVVSSATSSGGAFSRFAWFFDARGRFDACYSCTNSTCSCNADAEERGCWAGSITLPSDSFDVQGDIPSGSDWERHLQFFRGGAGRRQRDWGCFTGVTGNFDRSAVANQDPLFYLHHAFTFMVSDRAMRHQHEHGIPGPFFGLDEMDQAQQCEGHNVDDVTIFSNLVPYTTGQTPGARHTWRDILVAWNFDRREFRWVLEGEV
jgi:hypothetical protein